MQHALLDRLGSACYSVVIAVNNKERTVDLKKKLAELNEKIFLAGHRHDEGAWQRYTEKAVAIADELDLRYKVTGYGLDILED